MTAASVRDKVESCLVLLSDNDGTCLLSRRQNKQIPDRPERW